MNDKEQFEQDVARYNNRRYGIACQHPNYMALLSVMSERNQHRLRRGQEVILSAVGTTLADVLELGLVPVFVDVELPGYNPNPCLVEEAVNKETGAVLLQHTLGNPIAVKYISDRVLECNTIWSICDCGEAIGGTCTGTYAGQPIGSFGDLSTFSFRNAELILTDSTHLAELLREDCHCRFLRNDDFMTRLPVIIKEQRDNWKFLHEAFLAEGLDEYFILPAPHYMASPNWQGFCLTCRGERTKLVQYLNKNGVPTHLLPIQSYKGHRMVGTSKNVEIVREKSFWIDVNPRFTQKREYVVDCFKRGLKQ